MPDDISGHYGKRGQPADFSSFHAGDGDAAIVLIARALQYIMLQLASMRLPFARWPCEHMTLSMISAATKTRDELMHTIVTG